MKQQLYFDKFINSYIENVGIRTISENELLKLATRNKAISLSKINIDAKVMYKKYRILLTTKDVFLTKPAQFEVGDYIYIYSQSNKRDNFYSLKKKGVIIFVSEKFVTIKCSNYTESILFTALQEGEYLIYSKGKV